MTTSRSVRAVAVGAVAVVATMILGTGVAHADGHVSGEVSCVAGNQVIAWNYSSNGEAGTIASAVMSGQATGSVTMSPTTLTSQADEANGTATVGGSVTGIVTLTVNFTPDDAQPFVDDGDVTLPGGCGGPTSSSSSIDPTSSSTSSSQ